MCLLCAVSISAISLRFHHRCHRAARPRAHGRGERGRGSFDDFILFLWPNVNRPEMRRIFDFDKHENWPQTVWKTTEKKKKNENVRTMAGRCAALSVTSTVLASCERACVCEIDRYSYLNECIRYISIYLCSAFNSRAINADDKRTSAPFTAELRRPWWRCRYAARDDREKKNFIRRNISQTFAICLFAW